MGAQPRDAAIVWLKNLKSLRAIFFVLGSVVPPAIVLLVIRRFGVNVPYWDDWAVVPDLEAIHRHQFKLIDLFNQHNEHRMFFPRLIMLGLSFLTRWNILFELYATWIFIGVTWLFLCSLLQITVKDSPNAIKPLAIVQAALLFSLSQGENFIWGWQLQWFFAELFVVVSVWALFYWKGSWIGIVSASLAAFVATYSIASGQLIWILGIVALVVEKEKWKIGHAAIWLGSGTISIVGYFLDFSKSDTRIGTFIHQPLAFVQFILTTLGSPFGAIGQSGELTISATAGAVGLILFVCSTVWIFVKKQDWFSKLMPWMLLSLYGLFSVMLTAMGRLQYGVESQALITRYSIFSLMFWSGTCVLAAIFIMQIQTGHILKIRGAFVFIALLFLFGYVATAIRRYDDLGYYTHRFQIGKSCLYNLSKASDRDLKLISYFPSDEIRESASFLESQQFGPYANGSGSELVAHITSEWSQEVQDLNLQSVQVDPHSIYFSPEDVIGAKSIDDTWTFTVKRKPEINFSINFQDIPNWENEKRRRILSIYSQNANHILVHWKELNQIRVFSIFSVPLDEDWRVFRYVLPPEVQDPGFRLDYSGDLPLKDRLKIICFVPTRG